MFVALINIKFVANNWAINELELHANQLVPTNWNGNLTLWIRWIDGRIHIGLNGIETGLLIYVVMKQWRLRSSAKKLAHFEPRHGGSASVPLNGGDGDKHGKQCDISPCGSRRLNESDGSRGSRGSDSAFVAPGSDGYSRDAKLSKSLPSFLLIRFLLLRLKCIA